MKWPALLAVALACYIAWSCDRPTPADKLAKLDALKLETLADLHRSRAECEADTIEFRGGDVAAMCWDTFRVDAEAARRTLADIAKRRRQIEETGH